MSDTRPHVVGMVYYEDTIQLVKQIFEPESLSKDLSSTLAEKMEQQLQC